METKASVRIYVDKALQGEGPSSRKRLKCSFPIVIKGINILGYCYEKIAVAENIGGRGICVRTFEALIPGSIFVLYQTDDEERIEPIATFEVIWIKAANGKGMLIGAQLLGDNRSWLRYLFQDVLIPPKP